LHSIAREIAAGIFEAKLMKIHNRMAVFWPSINSPFQIFLPI